MRGKVKQTLKAASGHGITPAYAGKSILYAAGAFCSWDHPRVCGEKIIIGKRQVGKTGSPPRMRGKAHRASGRNALSGITPAYAGKRSWKESRPCACGDHPRVCGEKCRFQLAVRNPLGSPPRMRGKGFPAALSCRRARITPAYAGKSLPPDNNPSTSWDHPRVCGEKFLVYRYPMNHLGSPPRMRGKGKKWHIGNKRAGITPAYAGKRLKRSRSTVSPVAIVPLFPSVCNKPVVSDGSPAGRDAPLFLPAENAVPASPACNLRSL